MYSGHSRVRGRTFYYIIIISFFFFVMEIFDLWTSLNYHPSRGGRISFLVRILIFSQSGSDIPSHPCTRPLSLTHSLPLNPTAASYALPFFPLNPTLVPPLFLTLPPNTTQPSLKGDTKEELSIMKMKEILEQLLFVFVTNQKHSTRVPPCSEKVSRILMLKLYHGSSASFLRNDLSASWRHGHPSNKSKHFFHMINPIILPPYS